MQIVQGLATAFSLLSILSFALYVVALLRMPTGHRPTIVPTDRLGRSLPPTYNPDYHDTEDEQSG